MNNHDSRFDSANLERKQRAAKLATRERLLCEINAAESVDDLKELLTFLTIKATS